MTQDIRPINWGIIGCGDVVLRKSAPSILSLPGQRIVSAMRRDPDALAAFANRFAVPHAAGSADELVANPAVDLVYIATPPDTHLHYARLAAAAGKGVLVEKPAGRCAAETREIAAACAAARVPCYVSYNRRHLPRVRLVRDLLDTGAIGPIVSVRYALHERTTFEVPRHTPSQSGGGRFFDLGGHVLDQLEHYFGPLEFLDGNARNLIARHETEDFVSLRFRGRGRDGEPVTGDAEWFFAAPDKQDELVIEGMRGRIVCPGMNLGGRVVVELDRTLHKKGKGSPVTRVAKLLRNRLRAMDRRTHVFGKPEHSHAALFAAIAEDLAGGGSAHGIESAVRVTTIMDRALEAHYGDRSPGFWSHPERWQSLRARARRSLSAGGAPSRYDDVSEADRRRFEQEGWAGPFDADVPGIGSVFVPAKERKDLHLRDPQILALCVHPSVTRRVAALVGTRDLSIFKTRVHLKVANTSRNARKHAIVPWHQDVGEGNGGYYPNGAAIPTYTVWMALDDVGADAGALCVLPGTHRKLYGRYEDNFHAKLLERGDLKPEDLAGAVALTMRRGQYVVFHSWLLHGSPSNESAGRRAGFNIRFVRNVDRLEGGYEYLELSPLEAGEGADVPGEPLTVIA